MASASEVPGRFDCVINSQGYVFDRTRESTLYGSRARAEYSYTPTFIERTNISNSYGDNAQDFFLTIRQRDWSLGEQQKFFRAGNDGRYWMASNVDVSTPGQVRLSQGVSSLTFAASVRACARERFTQDVVCAATTNLYRVTGTSGALTDLGAHGLGAAPSRYGIANDATSIFLSTTSSGTVGVRRWDGASFSTFSATGSDSLAFLNNTLFGYQGATSGSHLISYDTSGNPTTLFTWKAAQGSAATSTVPKLVPFGGKLLIAFVYAQEASELWIWDGAGASRLEVFPENFIISDLDILYGISYIAGSFLRPSGSLNVLRSAVLFFDGSQIGKLWQANDYNATTVSDLIVGPHPALGVNDGRLIFTDETTGNLMAYDPARGGVSTVGSFTANAGDSTQIASTGQCVVMTRNQTGGYYFPATSYPSAGYVISSLIDFDSSLTKIFRGATVEFNAASDGNGGSIDIAYQIDSLTGSWTSLATGVTSGQEVTLPTNTTGHSIAFKITLNKGTSTSGPTLKSMNVRAAPSLTSFKIRTYNLDLTNTPNNQTLLQDGSIHPLTGHEQATNLIAAITSTSPISITDRFGTYTAVLEPGQSSILELHSDNGGGLPANSGQFIASIVAREV